MEVPRISFTIWSDKVGCQLTKSGWMLNCLRIMIIPLWIMLNEQQIQRKRLEPMSWTMESNRGGLWGSTDQDLLALWRKVQQVQLVRSENEQERGVRIRNKMYHGYACVFRPQWEYKGSGLVVPRQVRGPQEICGY